MSYTVPVGVVYGNASAATRFLRRTSAGSMPISTANRSTARSMAAVASGRPAPRYATTLAVVVTKDRALHSTFGMS